MPPKPLRKRQWQTILNRRIRELAELAREIDPEAETNGMKGLTSLFGFAGKEPEAVKGE